ncbi:hypothetical protein JXA40_04175 [bacterium]|nr:hypothetical protein [candidate division CSSED10-310 bacterium]
MIRSASGSPLRLHIAVIIAVFVTVVFLTPPQTNHTSRPDGIHYAAVVRWDLEAMKAPWCYRLLTPALVRLAESTGLFDDPFKPVTYPGVLGFLIVFWFILRNRAIAPWTATAVTAIAAFSYPSRKLIHQMSTADPLALLLLCAGILAIFQNRAGRFGLVTLLGAVNREAAFLLVPIAYIYWAKKPVDRDALTRLAWTLPAVGIFILIRLLVPVEGPGFWSFYADPAYLKECSDAQGGLTGMLTLTYTTFGIFWLTALLDCIRRPTRICAVTAVFALICFASCFFAHNTSREMMPVFPFLYFLTARFADRNRRWLPLILCIGVFQSLVKFSAMSSWHPFWLLNFRLSWLRGLELLVFLVLLLATSRGKKEMEATRSWIA